MAPAAQMGTIFSVHPSSCGRGRGPLQGFSCGLLEWAWSVKVAFTIHKVMKLLGTAVGVHL